MDRRSFLLTPLTIPVAASGVPPKTQHLRTLNILTWDALEFLLDTATAADGQWWRIAIRRMSRDFEQEDWSVPTPASEWVLFAPSGSNEKHTATTRKGATAQYQIDESYDCSLSGERSKTYVFLIAADGTQEICIRAVEGRSPVVACYQHI